MNYHIDILPGDISKGSPHRFDENGVIMTKIPYTQEYHYHATAIASYAISNEDSNNIKWLVKNIDSEGAYKHRFILPFYENFPTDWIGGLAQGLAISALVRAGETKTAEKAFKCLQKCCLYTNKSNYTWIEEYPLERPQYILNGFIYALFGVYDLFKITGNKKAKELFDSCIRTLQTHLGEYDLQGWSKYDLESGIPATPFYHNIHVKQLEALHNITDDGNEFFEYYKRWSNYHLPCRISMKRAKFLIEKNGVIGCWRRYRQRKRWLSES